MKSQRLTSVKLRGNFLSLGILGLLIIMLSGCLWIWKSGERGVLKEGGGVRVVVRTGDQAPGAPGAQFHMPTSLALNTSGKVAFKATLAGVGITSKNDEGIWVGEPGSLVLVAREGTGAPGTIGQQFGETIFPLEAPLLNDGGQIAFKALVSPGGPISQGIWVGTAGSLSLAARSGASAPGAEGGVTFRLFDDLRLNAAGQVAFRVSLDGSSITRDNDEGIWAGAPGNIAMVTRKGLATMPTHYSIVSTDRPAFDGLSLSDGPWGILRAQFPPTVTHVTQPSGASGVEVSYRYGIFRFRPGNIGSELVVRPGESIGGGPFVYLNEPGLNAAGNYAFAASHDRVTLDDDTRIWIKREGTLWAVAIENHRAPGTPDGVVYGDLAGVKVAVKNQDKMAFQASLRGPGVTASNNQGIWAGTREALSLVARSGHSAVGASGTAFSSFIEYHLNNAGDVAFMASLTGSGAASSNDIGIWAVRSGNLSLVAREGDSYQVAPGLNRTVIELKNGLAFNDSGQVAFIARFSDDTIGVVMVTP